MNKSNLCILLTLLVLACQNKKTETTMETTPAPAPVDTVAAAPTAPTVDIWASELGAKLKAEYIANPANQAETDQNTILEHAVKNNMDVKRTPSGLYFTMEKEGSGKSPKKENNVAIHYRGYFLDGREFDSSYKRNSPSELKVGQYVPGFAEGILLLKPGSKVKLLIPSGLGYGPMGHPAGIPGNTVLGFDVELLKIIK
ncbi:MAG: FKBP-type peptidyl-prolyl cis-trans isomerase [Saprospiraceae bacterium]|nr:FKBP-type peptidyl-prolyl cis-trans isomerase [Saprospiraceae bacterium]